MLCLLIRMDEKIVLTDTQTGVRIAFTPYLRTKGGTPELQFAIDAPARIQIAREKIEPLPAMRQNGYNSQ